MFLTSKVKTKYLVHDEFIHPNALRHLALTLCQEPCQTLHLRYLI